MAKQTFTSGDYRFMPTAMMYRGNLGIMWRCVAFGTISKGRKHLPERATRAQVAKAFGVTV